MHKEQPLNSESMDGEDRPNVLKNNDKLIARWNKKPNSYKENDMNEIFNSVRAQSFPCNKENSHVTINCNTFLLSGSPQKDVEVDNVIYENSKKSSKRNLPLEEGLYDMHFSSNKSLMKKTVHDERNSKLLKRFSSFAEEDFEDFGDNLEADKIDVVPSSTSNKIQQHVSDRPSEHETNFDILELFNFNNRMEHPTSSDLAVPEIRGVNNLVQDSSSVSTRCSSTQLHMKNSLLNEEESQKIFDLCNAKTFLAAVDAGKESHISNADQSLICNQSSVNPTIEKNSIGSSSLELNTSTLMKNFKGSFQSKCRTSEASKIICKGNKVSQEPISPEKAMPYALQHSGILSDIAGSQVQDSARLPVRNISMNHQAKPSSEICKQFTVRSTTIKPKFPGPAGLLPNLENLEGSNLTLASRMLSAIQDSGSKKTCGDEPLPSLTLGPLWSSMLQDLDIRPCSASSPLHRYNIERSVLRQHGSSSSSAVGSGGLRRVPLLVVQVNAVQPAHSQATLLLSDHTGEVSGLLSTSGVSTYLGSLTAGCVLLLCSVTVWHRSPARPPLLTITADNIAALYSPVRRLPPAVGQDDQIFQENGKDKESDVLDVKITSGLTLEERRRLKDKIGIDNILERSLVEEDHDFKVNCGKPNDSGVGVRHAPGSNAPEVVNSNRLNLPHSGRPSVALNCSASDSFKPPAPVAPHLRGSTTPLNRFEHSPGLRAGCSAPAVSGAAKSPFPRVHDPMKSTVLNTRTSNSASCLATTSASAMNCRNSDVDNGQLTFVKNSTSTFTPCTSKTSFKTSSPATPVTIKHVPPIRQNSGPRFRFSPIASCASAVRGSGMSQGTASNSRLISTLGQGAMSSLGAAAASRINVSTPGTTPFQASHFPNTKPSLQASKVSTYTSTPSRSSYCLSTNRQKQFSYKSTTSSLMPSTPGQSKVPVCESSAREAQGSEMSKRIPAEKSSEVSDVYMSAANSGAAAPTERELREIQELMAAFTEDDFDDF